MDKLVIIGTIVKPQGIKGEVKIIPYSDDVMRFYALKSVFIDEVKYPIEETRINNDSVFMKFTPIKDRNSAEALRNKHISIPVSELKRPPKGKYLVRDLIGSEVIVGGKRIGILNDILIYGAADVYVIKENDSKEIMFPALKDLILNVDIDKKLIILDEKRFSEVAVYED